MKKEAKYLHAIHLFYANTHYVYKYAIVATISIVGDSIYYLNQNCIINLTTIIIANHKNNSNEGIQGKISINPINIDNGVKHVNEIIFNKYISIQ